MELFAPDPSSNLLSGDGRVHYFGPILDPVEVAAYFETLRRTIPWRNDESVIFGKLIRTARQVAWYGDRAFSYTYSGTTKTALPWTPELQALKSRVEAHSGETYNSCLLNLYHHGEEGMAWHSDDESSLARHAAIASLSLGAERKFSFKHKRTGESISLMLKSGSLLVMEGATQTHWLHCLPKSKKVQDARINLTFRTMIQPT